MVQTGGVQASALIGTVKTGIITSTAYRTLVYLPLILLLAGCEFDSGNPGIVVSPTSGLVTKENGEPAHFTIVLNSKPDAMVTIAMSSSDPSEGEVKDKISFSASNWSTPQTVAVSGVDDNEMDGNIAYSINFQPSQSGDQRYNNLSLAAVSVVNQDDETTDQPKPNTRVTLTPPSGLVTSENLITDNFTVVLNSQPTNAVTIALTSSNTSEGTVSPANLTFTTSNWNLAQIVTVSGVDDNLKDGDTDYSIDFAVQSADNNFNNLTLTPVSVVNLDNDSAGVTVTPTMLLTTSEAQSSVSFSVVLNGQPASNVIISASSSDTSEGTVSPPSITFTPNNWSTAMQFVVTGVDDSLVDGTVAYSISLTAQSNDQNYNGINIPAVQLQNSDNDSTVPPSPNPAIITSPNSGLVTTETGTSASFTVVLTSAPISDVTVNVISSDTTEGLATPGSLTFTPNNWSSVQSVTVTGVDDPDADGDINYSIGFSVISSDIDYNGMTVTPVTAVNQNNDRAAITLSPASGLITSEDLDQDSFTVVLTSRPSSTATILLSSSDTSEGTVSPASLTFTTSNWNLPQTVNITGVNDSLVDGNVNYSINISVQSTDTNYNNMTVTPITAVNQDNDSAPPAGVAINPRSGLQTSEDLATDTFTIALTSQPASTVTIGLTSSDTTEGTVSPSSVSFSTTNWNSAQPVTVTGVNDTLVDGDINYSINFTVQSTDSNYNGLGVTPVSITNVDNESTSQAGITITPASGLQTSENLTSATFRLVLDSQPSNTVTISMSSSDTSEGTVSPSTVTFTTANWGTARTVAVTGVNDALVDGNVNYSIFFTVQSIDGNYNGMALTPVTVVNLDNDSAPAAGVTITPTSGLQTSEDLATAGFNIVLNSQPASTVTIGLTSSDTTEGTVAPSSISFTTANWSTAQPVTISGVDDTQVDGNVSYSINFNVQSTDTSYNGMAVAPVSVVNLDNDSAPAAGITITPASGLQTSEDLVTAGFNIVLNSQPTSTVTIGLTSSDTTEGTVAPSSISFTTANWSTAQPVTISGVDDAQVDGNVSYSISFNVQSTDTNYNGMTVTPVSVVNLDNDSTPPPNNYVLYIEPGIIDIAASTVTGNGAAQLPAMGYSLTATPAGKTPGPVIEAVVGQTTTVEVVNDHINPHRFEIQGLLTNTPEIAPGDTVQFQFTPTVAGVYRYGDPQLLRRAMGLQGAVVVRPAGNPNTAWTGGPAFDQERTWVVSDFDETWLRSPSTVNLNQYNPNYFLINGLSGFAAKEDPATTIDGVVGETFLVRIVNAGQYDQSLHFHSNHFQIISEGGFKYTNLAEAPMVTTVNVKRGSTAMVLFTLSQTGVYPVHVHTAQMETSNGVYLNGTVTHIIGR